MIEIVHPAATEPPEEWTVEYVDAWMTALCEANPTARNPQAAILATCAYDATHAKGGLASDDCAPRCLIGAFLHAHGFEVGLGLHGESASTAVSEATFGRVNSSQRLLLPVFEEWQFAADFAPEDWRANRWCDVPALVEKGRS